MNPNDLRTRIAAVLGTVEVILDGWDYLNDTSRFLLADAVIRELGLQKQILHDGIIEYGEPHLWQHPCETRYVTEWIADE